MQGDYNSGDSAGYNTLKALEMAESRASDPRTRSQRPSGGSAANRSNASHSRTPGSSRNSGTARTTGNARSSASSRTAGTGSSTSSRISENSRSSSSSRTGTAYSSGGSGRYSSSASNASRAGGAARTSASSRAGVDYASGRTTRSASSNASRTSGGYASSRTSSSRPASSRQTSSRAPYSGSAGRSGSYGQTRSSGYRPTGSTASSRGAGHSASRPASRSSAARSGKKHRFLPSLEGFKRFAVIYAAVLVLILIVGLIIFSSFIGTYEKNQPVNIAASAVSDLSGDGAEKFLKSNISDSMMFEDQDSIISYALQSIQGKTLSYVENSDSRADAPSFNIKADDSVVAKLTLTSAGKGAFGLNSWKIGNLDIASYIPNTHSYSVLVPEGYTVTINDVELSDSLITEKDTVPSQLSGVTQFAKDLPKFNTYKVSGLLNVPEVKAKDASGNDVSVVTAAETIVVSGKPTDAFIQEQDEFVKGALQTWGYYFINYNSPNLAHYVQTGSDLYSYIFGSDTMDPIPTYFYDWEYISGVEFSTFEYGNFIQYSDDCYSVDVKYQLTVTFNNGNEPDDAQALDATWIIVKYNGVWAIADLQYHNGSDSSSSTSVSSTTGSTTSGSTQTETTTEPTT